MLPSGNDAAHQLAEFFGSFLMKDAEDREKKMKQDLEKQQKDEATRIANKIAAEEGKEDEPGDYRKKSASNDSNRAVNIQDKETNAQSSSQSDTHAAAAALDKHCNGSSSKRPQQDTEEKD